MNFISANSNLLAFLHLFEVEVGYEFSLYRHSGKYNSYVWHSFQKNVVEKYRNARMINKR